MDNNHIKRTKAACAYLGISRSAFLKLVSDGLIPKGIKLIPGGRAIGWMTSDLDKFLESRRAEA
jgi:predicted DNA-binding transcriptional regulator AlpA